jgi:hypothetical protein
MLLAPAAPGTFPPEESLAVVNLASSKTTEHDQPATRWSLDDLARAIPPSAAFPSLRSIPNTSKLFLILGTIRGRQSAEVNDAIRYRPVRAGLVSFPE